MQEVVVLNPLLRERITFFSERNINVHNPFKLADLAATLSSGSPDKLQAVLTEKSPEQRLRLALDIITKVLLTAVVRRFSKNRLLNEVLLLSCIRQSRFWLAPPPPNPFIPVCFRRCRE